MEGELETLSPARPSCVFSKGDGRWPRLRLADTRVVAGDPDGLASIMRLPRPWRCQRLHVQPADRGVFAGDAAQVAFIVRLRQPQRWDGLRLPTRASPLETLPNSLSSCVSDSRGEGDSSSLRVSKEREHEVQEAERLVLAIAERYSDCFLRLRDATAVLVDLRHERVLLRAENLQLSLLLAELKTEQSKQASVVALTPPPKPVQAEAAFGCAPRSISIRSKGFLSQQQQPRGESKPHRLRVRASLAVQEVGEKETEDGQVELEAYGQGALKTELCNKWERGACPYARRCRFAHGVQDP